MSLSEDYITTLNDILEIDSGNIFALNSLAKFYINNNDLNKTEELLIKSYIALIAVIVKLLFFLVIFH